MDQLNFASIMEEDNSLMDRITALNENCSERRVHPIPMHSNDNIDELLPLDQFLSIMGETPGLQYITVDESISHFEREEQDLKKRYPEINFNYKYPIRTTVAESSIIDELTITQNDSQPSYRNCNLEDACKDSTVIHQTLDSHQIYDLNANQVHQFNSKNTTPAMASAPSSSSQLLQNTGVKLSKNKKFTENNSENVISPNHQFIELKQNGVVHYYEIKKISKPKLEDVTLKLQNKSSDRLSEHKNETGSSNAISGNKAYSLLSKRVVINNYVKEKHTPLNAYDRSDHTYYINPNRNPMGQNRIANPKEVDRNKNPQDKERYKIPMAMNRHGLPTPTDSEGEIDVETAVQGPILILPTKPTRTQQMAIQQCMAHKISSENTKPSSSYTPQSATPSSSNCFNYDRTSYNTSSSTSVCDPTEYVPLINLEDNMMDSMEECREDKMDAIIEAIMEENIGDNFAENMGDNIIYGDENMQEIMEEIMGEMENIEYNIEGENIEQNIDQDNIDQVNINPDNIDEEIVGVDVCEFDDASFKVPVKKLKKSKKKKVVKKKKINDKLEASKRSDHNRKERNRRDALKCLFDNLLKVMKEDPCFQRSKKWSKNLILGTAKTEITNLLDKSNTLNSEINQLTARQNALKRRIIEMSNSLS